MQKELFGAIRDNYYQASSELWLWLKKANFLLKFIFFIWVLIASTALKLVGFIFSLGVLLDKVSVWIQSKRRNLLNILDDCSEKLNYEKSGYITSPLLALLFFPIAIFIGLIPKWSSTFVVAIHPDLDVSEAVEHGYFFQLGKKYIKLISKLFKNIATHGYFFGLFSFLISLISCPFILLMSFICFILIILDWLSLLVGFIRKFVINSSQGMARRVGDNVVFTILMPVLLIVFVPLYVFLLLIPKMVTDMDSN